jgi:ABC-2 type transport system permease protein
LNAYRAFVLARFRVLLQYRGAALANVFTQSFFGLVRIMILAAFYESAAPGAVQPMSFTQVVGYVWLSQATLALFPWGVDADIREAVRTGSVAYELCRPLDLYGVWFCRAMAWRAAPLTMRFVPLLVLAMVVLPLVGLPQWRLAGPASPAALALWAGAMVGALGVAAALTTLMNITLLWTGNGQGVAVLLATLTMIAGGLVIPVPLFPDWAQPVLRALPFAAVLDLPARAWTGNIPAGDAAWVLGHSLFWTVALVALGRAILARGLRRLVVQGG